MSITGLGHWGSGCGGGSFWKEFIENNTPILIGPFFAAGHLPSLTLAGT